MANAAPREISERTEAKLRYADVHLQQLRGSGAHSGTDFDRACEECFLFHLFGAIDAFLIELNTYYGAGLPEQDLSPGKLRKALAVRGLTSPELSELYELEKDPFSWLCHAKAMRDHSTHVSGIPRAFHLGGPHHRKVFLRNPSSGERVEMHVVDALGAWLQSMRDLLCKLRSSALNRNAL
jgi:hypothetical protein